uniref:ABO, alpha 1-3-N-acetylgalactosaminyltransferase and alpha 1-3-galactosyltransferase n=1 Tax=Homo sapiens TaxID=9606 RepID=A0A7P0TA91_HUMAN
MAEVLRTLAGTSTSGHFLHGPLS